MISPIDESATRQRAIIDALTEEGALMKPSQLAEATGLEPSNVRQAVREMLDAELLWQPKYGKYGLPEWKPKEESKPEENGAVPDLFSDERDANPVGHLPGFVVRHATGPNAGDIWFTIDFPDYMRVHTPAEFSVSTGAEMKVEHETDAAT